MEGPPSLPPPPPVKPPDVKPEIVASAAAKHSIMVRSRGSGITGRRIQLSTNHFKVSVKNTEAVLYQYCVTITYEDKTLVQGLGIGRKLVDKLYQTYASEFASKKFAYDEEKALYIVGPLPWNKFEFTVVLEESFAQSECGGPSETEKRLSSYAAKIPLKPISLALQGAAVNNTRDALKVLDIILRQKEAKLGCLLVRDSFSHDDSRNFVGIGGGVTGVRSFHLSFRPTQGGLSLNMDVSTTMIVTPGPVIDFLLINQGVREPRYIDWVKAKRMLKYLRIKTRHCNMEFKITGLSEKPCNQQYFSLKLRSSGGKRDEETVEITVYEYFIKNCGIELTYSEHMPCLDFGKLKRPVYVPIEYTKALSSMQRASLVENSRQKHQERICSVTYALKNYNYDDDAVLAECGITIEKQLIQMDVHVLETPKLKVGNSEDMMPFKGRWNFKGKSFLDPTRIKSWLVVNFSGRCDISQISRELINVGKKIGIHIEPPTTLIEEDPQAGRLGPVARVGKMFEQIQAKLQGPPEFILCVIPMKGSDIYGPWKKKTLVDFGISSQCISPPNISDPYLTNVLMKINTKLGGINSLLALEHSSRVPPVKDAPTMILGMDVSHGSPGQSDVPSVAAVVGSRNWPLISRYRSAVRTQSPKVEMKHALYKLLPNGKDDGIIREHLPNFYNTSKGRKPTQMIIFRDGVSESQFNQGLNIKLDQIVKAPKAVRHEKGPKHGTTILWYQLPTKLLVGVDSRSIQTYNPIVPNIIRSYDLLADDGVSKFVEIVPDVYATLCGDEVRIKEMLDFVQKEMGQYISNNLRQPPLYEIGLSATRYFRTHPMDDMKDKLSIIHMCRWMPGQQRYHVIEVGDKALTPLHVQDQVFGCGSGSHMALNMLDSMHSSGVQIDENIFLDQMIKAALTDPGTGGRLRVISLSSGRTLHWDTSLLSVLHHPLYTNMLFDGKSMFVIIQARDAHILCPADLVKEVKSFDAQISAMLVHWLCVLWKNGFVVYRVVLSLPQCCDSWFNSCDDFGGPTRSKYYTNGDGDSCVYYITYATEAIIDRILNMSSFQDLA